MNKCRSISKKDLESMMKLINMQEYTNKEHGALLCQKDDSIIFSGYCIGSKCGIIPKKFGGLSCPERTKEIGEFHTHPGGTDFSIPSPDDIKISVTENHKLICIGTGEKFPTGQHNRRINCYIIKNTELKKLGNEYLKADEDKRKNILNSINRIMSGKSIVNDLLNEKCMFEDVRGIKGIPPSRILEEKGKSIELNDHRE